MRKGGYGYSRKRGSRLIAFFLIPILSSLWYIIPRFLFPIQHFHIIGTSHITQEVLKKQLRKLKGKPLLHLTSKHLLSFLKKNGWIKRIELYKLPPHTLLLRIWERIPFLIVRSEGAAPLLVDEERFVVENPTERSNLPTLILPKVKIDEDQKVVFPFFEVVKEILEDLANTPIRIEKIVFLSENDIRLWTKGGFEIILGRPKDIFQKLYILKTYWQRMPNIENRFVYIDLSCYSKPAIMPKGE